MASAAGSLGRRAIVCTAVIIRRTARGLKLLTLWSTARFATNVAAARFAANAAAARFAANVAATWSTATPTGVATAATRGTRAAAGITAVATARITARRAIAPRFTTGGVAAICATRGAPSGGSTIGFGGGQTA